MTIIQVRNSKPVLSSQRRKSPDQIVFSYPGVPSAGEYSGRYFPAYGIDLTYVTFSAGTPGSGAINTQLWLLCLDQHDATKTKLVTPLELTPEEQYKSYNFEKKISLISSQWIGLVCLTVGNHKNLVVTVGTTPSTNGYFDRGYV